MSGVRKAPATAPEQEEPVVDETPEGLAAEVDKDAEIARLRAEAEESNRKLEALLAGQDIGPEPVDPTAEGDVEVEMRVAISGFRNGVPWPRVGGTIAVPAAEAAHLIAAGYAVRK